MPSDSRKILALDPATRTGFAHSNGHRGVWDLSRYSQASDKALALFREIHSAHDYWTVELVAIEEAGFGAGPGQLHTMAFHNQLRGAVMTAAGSIGAGLVAYKPTSIKKFATGNGRATKQQMVRAAKTVLGIEPRSDDEADALFILEMARQGFVTEAEVAKRAKLVRKREPRLF